MCSVGKEADEERLSVFHWKPPRPDPLNLDLDTKETNLHAVQLMIVW